MIRPYRNYPLCVIAAVCGMVFVSLEPQDAKAQQTQATATTPTLTVSIAKPELRALSVNVSGTGPIAAWHEAVISSEVQGQRLVSVAAQVGDVVRKGQILAEFDAEGLRMEVTAARAAVSLANANYEQAVSESKRVRSLTDTGALSQSQIGQVLSQEKVAAAQLDSVQASLEVAELRLRQARVRAVDDGVISARQAAVGAVVGSGQELFRLIRKGRLEWRAEVTPAEAAGVRKGMLALVNADGLSGPVQGVVRAIAPSADSQTRNVTVFVDLPAVPSLKAGAFARGQIALRNAEALTVPSQAVVMRDGHANVFVLSAQQTAVMRRVRLGRNLGDAIEVTQGINATDTLIVQGAGFLNDGDAVKVVRR